VTRSAKVAPVRLTFDDATENDLDALTALHAAAAADLTERFGVGHWSRPAILRRLDTVYGRSRIRVGREGRRLVTALRLQTKKPWAIDNAYFTPVARPLYLTGMVVAVDRHHQGLGRAALVDADEIAASWPANAIRLDAYDAAAGAGGFYAACGYVERGRAVYKGNPLIYYERVLP
jgi:GNAT superfamily N-acetyltransferase